MNIKDETEKILSSAIEDVSLKNTYSINGIEILSPFNGYDYSTFRSIQTVDELFTQHFINDEEIINLLAEIRGRIELTGNSHGIDIFNTWFLLEASNVDFSKSTLFKIPCDDYGNLQLEDKDSILRGLKEIINSEFKAAFIDLASILIPQRSPGWQDREELKSILKLNNIEVDNMVILDLGTGMGTSREDWEEIFTGSSFIGFERQYISRYFEQFWRDKDNVIADIREMPIKSNSSDLVLLEFVAQHMSEESLQKTLNEALRILKNNGCLAITPQDGGWRIYRKAETAPNSSTYELIELTQT